MKTVSQVAKGLNVSIGLVYGLIRKRELRAYRIASAIRISDEDLNDYKARCAVGPRLPKPKREDWASLGQPPRLA